MSFHVIPTKAGDRTRPSVLEQPSRAARSLQAGVLFSRDGPGRRAQSEKRWFVVPQNDVPRPLVPQSLGIGSKLLDQVQDVVSVSQRVVLSLSLWATRRRHTKRHASKQNAEGCDVLYMQISGVLPI